MMPASSWSPADRAALALLVVGAAVSLVWLVHPWFDVRNDASLYILGARSMLAGDGFTYLGQPIALHPPGFPMLLMPVLYLVGTSFETLNLYVSLYGILGVALLYVYARPRLGLGPAFAIAAAVWLNPFFQRLSNQLMSDVPATAFLLGSLVVARWADRSPSPRRDLALGLCIGGMAYVRSVCLLLAPAVVLARLLHRWVSGESVSWRLFLVRRASLPIVVPLLLLVPWHVRNALHPSQAPAELTSSYSQWTALAKTDIGDPASPPVRLPELLSRMPVRLGALLGYLGSRMGAARAGPGHIAVGAAVLVCWLLVLFRRRGPGEIFVLAMLCILAIFCQFQPRFAIAVYLLVLMAVAECLLLALRSLDIRLARAITVALIALLALADFAPRAAWPQIRAQHQEFAEGASGLRERFPPDTPIAAGIGSPFAVFLERPVYTFLHKMRREGLPAALGLFDQRRVGAVVVHRYRDQELLDHLSNHSDRLLDVGSHVVFRLDERPSQ